MWRLSYWCLLATVGCGNVASQAADARTDSAPDALVCSGNQMVCDRACVDLATDEQNCGSCGTQCGANTQCGGGHCIESDLNCAAIKAIDPNAASGPYTHAADGHKFFCDMTAGPMQYEEVAIGQYDVVHTGYEFASAADLQNPVLQQAFITLANNQGGIKLIASWTVANCCMKQDNSTNELFLGGTIVYPGLIAGSYQCGGAMSNTLWSIFTNSDGVTAPVPIPSDYFTTHPATVGAQCGEGANPALFWKRHP